MEHLKKITHAVWQARQRISFGESAQWNGNCFLQSWVNSVSPGAWDNSPGWYWIESDISAVELSGIALPTSIAPKAIKFSEIARENLERFDRSDLCESRGCSVIYNGQEKRVFTRLRTHYSLTAHNSATGALAIGSYPLSARQWTASYFHKGMISKLSTLATADKEMLSTKINAKYYRELVEMCWRMEFGWPILSKK
ncbi:MAG: hypothetical protein ACN6PR_03535 [Achromobacter sp.]